MIPKAKILVVDDDLAALELIARTLELLGTSPKCVQASSTAVELINKEKFDGIFLDWMMPELDGLELARRIRQSKPNPTVPIIMLTAKTEPESMRLAFQAGVNCFLTKPLTADKVQRLLNASRGMILAERRRYRRVVVSLEIRCAWNEERVKASTLNLSSSGILLRAAKLPPKGVDVRLSLKLPERTTPMELVGNVVRVVQGTDVAIQFKKYGPGDRELLAEFVEKTARTLPQEKVF